MRGRVFFGALALMCSVSSTVLADDWVAERLRGSVVQMQGGQWVPMQRGDVIPDARKVRTGADGRLELVRGQERISLVANTEIAIQDAAGQKMTSVLQSFGTVSIEAERRNVQHFSVQTPVLAAVVKGTKFTVTYADGAASVSVERGVVQVQDTVHNVVADVQRGQSAEVAVSVPLDVSGPGSNRTVFLIEGQPVSAARRDVVVAGASMPTVEAEVRGSGTSASVGSSGNGLALGLGNGGGNGNGLALGLSGSGNGGNSGNGNGGGLALGLGNGAGNGANAGSGVSAEVKAPAVSASAGVSSGGVDAGVSAGGLGLGVGLGNSGHGNSGDDNSGSGNSGSGNSGNGGGGNSGNGVNVQVNTGLGLGIGLRL